MSNIAYNGRSKVVETEVYTDDFKSSKLSLVQRLPLEEGKQVVLDMVTKSKSKKEKQKLDAISIQRVKTKYQLVKYVADFFLAGEGLSTVDSVRWKTRELARGY